LTNKSPIARKLMALIVAFSAAITLITTGAQLFLDYRKDLTGIREQVEALKTTQMDSLSRCVWTYDAQGIQTIINSAVNIKDIEYLSVQINNWSQIKPLRQPCPYTSGTDRLTGLSDR
jgi:hypothetical protein